MTNILIMTHGGLAEGLADSAQMILGPQDAIDCLSFRPDWSLERLSDELRLKLDAAGEAETLVMVDLFGGTPSNAIATVLAEGRAVGAVAGTNLPMVIEALMSRDEYEGAMALAAHVCEVGGQAVVNVGASLLDDDEDDED